MTGYLLRKLLQAVPTLFGVALVIFVLFDWVGGDPTYQMVGRHANAKQIAEVRQEYGFDQPKLAQFARYLGQVVTFDYGRSFATKRPIMDMIVEGIGPSLTLTLPAFLLTSFFAVAISLWVAYHRGKLIDRVAVLACVVGMSLPMLAYVLFGQSFLAYQLGWFPISGYDSDWPERLKYVALPVLIWVMVSLGYEVRFFRAALIEETKQDYVRTARAKGLSEPLVFSRHVLKNGMVPIITNLMLELPLLILGTFLLETFFGIPGIGSITINAIHNSDFPVIKAMTTLQALLIIASNLVTDVLYAWVDPRVKLG